MMLVTIFPPVTFLAYSFSLSIYILRWWHFLGFFAVDRGITVVVDWAIVWLLRYQETSVAERRTSRRDGESVEEPSVHRQVVFILLSARHLPEAP